MAAPLRAHVTAAWRRHCLSGEKRPLAPVPLSGADGRTHPSPQTKRACHGEPRPRKGDPGLWGWSRSKFQDHGGRLPQCVQRPREDALRHACPTSSLVTCPGASPRRPSVTPSVSELEWAAQKRRDQPLAGQSREQRLRRAVTCPRSPSEFVVELGTESVS